jgi:hypothetical protein
LEFLSGITSLALYTEEVVRKGKILLAAKQKLRQNQGLQSAEYIPTHNSDIFAGAPMPSSSPDSPPAPSSDSALVGALRRVLVPLARLMLAKGMTLPLAIELLKRAFVETAQRNFQLDDKPMTDSRVSLISGVHRKDVKRLRDLPEVDAALPSKVSLGAQLVGRWVTQKPWVDSKGTPKPLARLSSKGKKLSFEALVASVSRDIRPRSVLDEWLRLNVVSVNDADEVILNTAAFVPREGAEEKLHYLGLNLGDHAETACANVIGGTAPRFERSVHHDGLTAEQVVRLQKRATELGMVLLQTLHAEAEAMKTSAADVPTTRRFTCGLYWYDGARGVPGQETEQ